jgi:hypothetical protein
MRINCGAYWREGFYQFGLGLIILRHDPSHIDIVFDFAFWWIEITIGEEPE